MADGFGNREELQMPSCSGGVEIPILAHRER